MKLWGLTECLESKCAELEVKSNSELCLERNSQRLRETGCAEEIDRLAEVCLAGHVLELVPVVASIENIEGLKEQSEFHRFFKLEELRNTNVQLREAVPPQIVKGEFMLIVDTRIYRVTIIVNAVAIDVAQARRKDTIRSSRCKLQNRSDLKIPWQIKDSGQHKAVSFIFTRRTKINGIEFRKEVLGLKTEVLRDAKPALRLRQRIVCIQLELVGITLLE